jgi:hypothetical protein
MEVAKLMINNYRGKVFDGSSDLQTSVADQEIIPNGNTYVNFSLQNDQNCHIIINSGDSIFIRASQGIFVDVISSCKIVEDNITFNWFAQKN